MEFNFEFSSVDKAEELSYSIADVLCWFRGFMAANPNNEHGPLGTNDLRDFNIRLKSAIVRFKERRGATHQ